MKKLLIFLFVFLWLVTFAFAQTASTKKVEHSSKESEPKTIVLKPTQLRILTDLDSAKVAFNADVEKNKEVINTFNTLMQRSTALGTQQKQAYDLILEGWGYDPKKYVITGVDLKKGEIQLTETK